MFKRLFGLNKKSSTPSSNDSDLKPISISFTDEVAVKQIDRIKSFGVSDSEIADTYQKFNGRERDIVWSLYNKLLIAKPYEAASIYRLMSRMLYEEGKDFSELLIKANEHQLSGILDAGINHVSILCGHGRTCSTGLELESLGAIPIKEAQEKSLLPSKQCEKGYCECYYTGIFLD